MDVASFLRDNWFDLLQTIGIIAGLLFTCITIIDDRKSRRATNLLAITQKHSDLWLHFARRKELHRILKTEVDLKRHPVTIPEQEFVSVVILHLASVVQVYKEGLYPVPERLETDISEFFNLPIPKIVWEKQKHLHSPELIALVERSMFQHPR